MVRGLGREILLENESYGDNGSGDENSNDMKNNSGG
jgi:hypothetical protein